MTELKPDICVIGGGAAGLTLTAFAAMLGVPVVLIEKHAMGGECLNSGCVPSKALLAAAKQAHEARHAARFGIETGAVTVDFTKLRGHISAAIAAIRPMDSAARMTALGATVIKGEARFTGPREVKVGETTIRARRFVIATGAEPAIPDIAGLSDVPFLTHETIFDLPEVPAHLAILGGGPVGLEMAQAFRRLGAMVTLLEPAMIAADADREQAQLLQSCLEREGIDIHQGVEVKAVRKDGANLILTVTNGQQTDELMASHLLVATGRKPVVDCLNLGAAAIDAGKDGITINDQFRTRNRFVYAIGDCTKGPHLTSYAGWAAAQVAQAIIFRRPISTTALVPWCIFTDPEMAHVGLTEQEARKTHRNVTVLRWPFHDNDRAVTEGKGDGHVKLMLDHRDHIIGASIIGPQAGELIAPWVMAVQKKLTAAEMAGFILPYPTLAEAGKRAAATVYGAKLSNPWLKRLIALLRPFG